MRKANMAMIIVWSFIILLILAALIGGIIYKNSSSSSIGIIGGADGPTSIYVARKNSDKTLLMDASLSMDGIERIALDLSSESVDIFPAEGNEIRVVQYGINVDKERIIVAEQSGSTLNIRRRGGTSFFNFNFGFGTRNASWVEVYLPAAYQKEFAVDMSSGDLRINVDMALQDLNVQLTSGDVRSDYTLKSDTVTLDVSSGNIRLDEIVAKNYSLDVTSGKIVVDNLSGSGNIEMSSGTVKLDNITIDDTLNVNITSGTLDMALAGDPSLQYNGKVTSGTLNTYFDNSHKGDGSFTVGDGPYKNLNVDVSSGTVHITSAEGSSDKAISVRESGAESSEDYQDKLDKFEDKMNEMGEDIDETMNDAFNH